MRLTPRSNEFYPLFSKFGDHLIEGAQLLVKLMVASGDERAQIGARMREVGARG